VSEELAQIPYVDLGLAYWRQRQYGHGEDPVQMNRVLESP